MRDNWTRFSKVIELADSELEELIAPAFPGRAVTTSEHAAGGLANTNIRLELDDDQAVLLRIYQHDPAQAKKEHSIGSLIDGKVPSPRFLYFSPDNPVTGHPYAILSWVEGMLLSAVAMHLDDSEAGALGQRVGTALRSIHAITFEHAGLLDGELRVNEPMEMSGQGLLDYARHCLIDSGGEAHLGADLSARLMNFLAREALILDQWQGKPCLTHSDFGGSNILVTKATDAWEVAAVLDWEFAFSGTPFFDFGNLLRDPLGAVPGFAQGVAAGYTAAGGGLPPQWRKMSLLSDLTSWLEFLTRPQASGGVLADARNVIAGTIDRW